MKLPFVVFLLLFCLIGCNKKGCVTEDLERRISQNATMYIKDNFVVKADDQKKLADAFLTHFFSPWDKNNFYTALGVIKKQQIEVIQKYQKKDFVGENTHVYPKAWIAGITKNANFAKFPNLRMRAITIHNANIKMLPTMDPAFESWNKPGEGYPFDCIQQSFITANTPIFVWHISQDGAWYFIMTDSQTGWIAREDVAFVDDNFIRIWKASDYVSSIQDNISLFDENKNFFLKTRIGGLYPVVKKRGFYYKILIAVMSHHHFAAPKIVTLPAKYAIKFPWQASSKNVAELANKMLGNYYGWGGVYGYRDCSTTLKDLFAPFGIWLPRNSQDQLQASSFIDLSHLGKTEKANILLQKGIPFFTIIHLPGHILLYLGKTNDNIFVFHDMWGLRTKNLFSQEGRMIVGKTVITPITFGKEYYDVKKTFLDSADGVRVLL